MKICPICNTQLEDSVVFCNNCGARISGQPGDGNTSRFDGAYPPPPYQTPVPNPYDHTSEFEPQDISDNKVISMLVYLMGIVGVVIALLAGSTSKYAGFHVRQALKFTVIETLLVIVGVLLYWTAIVPFAAVTAYLVLFVIKIISFFQVCSGKAVEPAIIRNLNFLR